MWQKNHNQSTPSEVQYYIRDDNPLPIVTMAISSSSNNAPANQAPRRVSPRARKYVVGSSFAGMDGGPSKTDYKVGVNGGVYRSTDKRAPKSAGFGVGGSSSGPFFGKKMRR